MANPNVTQEKDTEVINFSKAEAKAYQKKVKAYNEAGAAVNEFMEFLLEQYEIDPKDGWKLGEMKFFRPIAKPDAPDAPAAPAAENPKKPSGKGKKGKPAEEEPQFVVEVDEIVALEELPAAAQI